MTKLFRLAPWTISLAAVALVANAAFVVSGGSESGFGAQLLEVLQFDRSAIAGGELWRLLTGNLVHWSAAHFWLDAGMFLIVGLVYERSVGKRYPWILLGAAGAVGLSISTFLPDLEWYRGLSGVCSGQFAVAILTELRHARNATGRVLAGLAATVFSTKIAYECLTGQMFFGTEGLGDLGVPIPLAHLAGTLGALLAIGAYAAANAPRSTRVTASAATSARGTD